MFRWVQGGGSYWAIHLEIGRQTQESAIEPFRQSAIGSVSHWVIHLQLGGQTQLLGLSGKLRGHSEPESAVGSFIPSRQLRRQPLGHLGKLRSQPLGHSSRAREANSQPLGHLGKLRSQPLGNSSPDRWAISGVSHWVIHLQIGGQSQESAIGSFISR